jgi:hypothetical protein
LEAASRPSLAQEDVMATGLSLHLPFDFFPDERHSMITKDIVACMLVMEMR